MEPLRYTEAQQFGRITAEYDRHECALWLVWADNQLVLNSQEAAGLLTYLDNLRYQIFNRQQQEPRRSNRGEAEERPELREAGEAVLQGHRLSAAGRQALRRARRLERGVHPDGSAVRQGLVLPQDGRNVGAGQERLRLPHHPGSRADQARPHPDVQGSRVADQVEPRPAAEADRVVELARQGEEGLQRQGLVPDGLRAGDHDDSDGFDADHDRLSD